MQTVEICVTVSNGNGCEGTACETIIVNESPAPQIAPLDPVLCYGESVTLDAGPGFLAYQWSTGETTRMIQRTPDTTEEICVTVTGPYGCQNTVCETVVVHSLPVVDILPDNPTLCLTESVELDAGDGDYTSFLWSTGETTRKISVAPGASTVYTCTVVNAYGCSVTAEETVNVFVPDAPPTAGNTIRIVDSGGGIYFEWQGLSEVPLYRLKSDVAKYFADPQVVKELGGYDGTMTTNLEQPQADLVFYRVVGVNCANVEGP
jgi:hypothetical protein